MTITRPLLSNDFSVKNEQLLEFWPTTVTPLIERVYEAFVLDLNDIHGFRHWLRVLVNWLKLKNAE
ncbi:hypothetical protein N9L49_03800 [Rhodospirillales bacterium]|nr:hypothetical protein [Rhodospirillales bacterium]